MKVLVAGLGSIGQRHARNLRTLFGSDVTLLAFRQRGLSRVIIDGAVVDTPKSVEEFFDITPFDDLGAALAERPDAVLVCNPTSRHVVVAHAAIDAGCHVLVEKPLSHSDEGVDALASAAERKNLVAAVGYQMRFHPALRCVRRLLQGNVIGEVTSAAAAWVEYLPDAHPYEDYRTGYAARRDLGGGVLLCYIHEVDYLCWLFGPPSAVKAHGGASGTLDIDVEDHVTIEMQCAGRDRGIPVTVRQSFCERAPQRWCRIHGTAGRIDMDLINPTVTVTDAAGAVTARHAFAELRRNDLFVDELRHFAGAMRRDHPPAVSLRDGIVSLRVVLAARESMERGHPIALAW